MELGTQGGLGSEGVLGVAVTLEDEAREVLTEDGGLLLSIGVVDV